MSPKKRARPQRRAKRRQKRERPFVPSEGLRVTEAEVELRPGKGGPRSGGGPGEFYWHVFIGDSRAGRAWIAYHETDLGEPHPSVTVMLNKNSRGRGIGTIAFRRAAELSPYDEVFATVARKNIASRKALARAGFVTAASKKGSELYMVWRRHGT